jgi:predicted secreted protein
MMRLTLGATLRVLVTAAVCLVMAGCGQNAVPVTACQTERIGGARPLLTEIDNGRCLALTMGGTAELRLSGTYRWSTPRTWGKSVELVPIAFASDPRSGIRDPGYAAWEIRAMQPGTATIAATGACVVANCSTATLAVSLTIAVSP